MADVSTQFVSGSPRSVLIFRYNDLSKLLDMLMNFTLIYDEKLLNDKSKELQRETAILDGFRRIEIYVVESTAMPP